jgi:hypothetical protein
MSTRQIANTSVLSSFMDLKTITLFVASVICVTLQ